MAKEETLIEKLRAENMELVQALEKIKELCADVDIPGDEACLQILKIIDDTLSN